MHIRLIETLVGATVAPPCCTLLDTAMQTETLSAIDVISAAAQVSSFPLQSQSHPLRIGSLLVEVKVLLLNLGHR